MSVKNELIEHWKKSINDRRCMKATCKIIEKQRDFRGNCEICPLDFMVNSEMLLCFSHTWKKLSKKQFTTAIEMAKKIPAKYYTASTFDRNKFQPIYRFIQKSVD